LFHAVSKNNSLGVTVRGDFSSGQDHLGEASKPPRAPAADVPTVYSVFIQHLDGVLRILFRRHFNESKPPASSRVPIPDDMRGFHCSGSAK
jgi:hypothetical protein